MNFLRLKTLVASIVCSGIIATSGVAQTSNEVDQLSGPRFGITVVGDGSTSQVLNRIHEMDSLTYSAAYPNGGLPFTWTTQYGWQWETRFADTGGPVIGLVEWVVFVAGMEKGLILPSFSSLIGVRGQKGFEFATGPNLSPTGLGFVFALGYNIKKGDLNMPINIALVPDKMGPVNSVLADIIETDEWFTRANKMRETGYRLTVTVGFNLQARGN